MLDTFLFVQKIFQQSSVFRLLQNRESDESRSDLYTRVTATALASGFKRFHYGDQAYATVLHCEHRDRVNLISILICSGSWCVWSVGPQGRAGRPNIARRGIRRP